MKKIFVVVGQRQEGNFVMGLFSNKKDAEQFIKQHNKSEGWNYDPYIEEHYLIGE